MMYLGKIIGLSAVVALSACSDKSHGSAITPVSADVVASAEKAGQSVSSPSVNGESVSAASVSSTPRNLRDSYYSCAESTDGSTWDIQGCIEEEFNYQDGRLNAVYRELQSKLPEAQRKRLRQDERKWLADSDETCNWNAETEGQAQRIEANVCALKRTADRVVQLERMLKDL